MPVNVHKYLTSKELVELARTPNTRFLVPSRRVSKIPFLSDLFGLGFVANTDTEEVAEYVVDESRYKLSENYKIGLKPIDEGFEPHNFYLLDLVAMIRQGTVTVKS